MNKLHINFNFIVSILLLILLCMLYEKYCKQTPSYNYNDLKKILENSEKSGKPILWIHVPHEYNSRNWINFGSRSSYDLNQPYLYLTVNSIVTNCKDSFTICLIDDSSFEKLVPNWDIKMKYLSPPLSTNARMYGMMKLLYEYGGMICPISFLCFKDLYSLYNEQEKFFVCEFANNTLLNDTFIPSLKMCGSKKRNPVVNSLLEYIDSIIKTDYTFSQNITGKINEWLLNNKDNLKIIDGSLIGTKIKHDKPLIIDYLFYTEPIKFYDNSYGVYIPAEDLLSRIQFGWFVRMSPEQVLDMKNAIGYLFNGIHKTLKESFKPNWVGFWKTPLYPGLYGLKPNYLGDNVRKVPYTGL